MFHDSPLEDIGSAVRAVSALILSYLIEVSWVPSFLGGHKDVAWNNWSIDLHKDEVAF